MDALELHTKWMILVFIIGYVCITIEHLIHVNKATTALLMGIICWVIQFLYGSTECGGALPCLQEHIAEISQIVFFLIGALAIVELISAHNGFAIIANAIDFRSKRSLLWVVGLIAFFLSAILDNLTTTIVMVTLIGKLIDKGEDRLMLGGAVVIAANAGGAWTPIGDVTTTMLWVGGQISTLNVMRHLFFPSVMTLVASFAVLSLMLKGSFKPKEVHLEGNKVEPRGKLILFLGVACLVFVPIFKVLTGLPPFMGVLFGVGVLWLITDILHRNHGDRDHLRIPSVMTKVDFSSILFFLGILLAIDALDTAGVLKKLALSLDALFTHPAYLATLIGLASAVVDNVPLVAATMGMYTMTQYPVDDSFWQLIAYCAGTGGSILIIGSAAGVVFMGLEKVNFIWYCKKISLAALVGYFAGIALYLLNANL
ncbi:MAG: sodium:proton antiporter NhaD [Parachlamydiaceae bacterium]